jgi:hypothetical protein
VSVLIDRERMMSIEYVYSPMDQRIVIEHHAEDGVPGGDVSPHRRSRDASSLQVSLRRGGRTFGFKKRYDMFRQDVALLANVVARRLKGKKWRRVASLFRSVRAFLHISRA